MSDQDVNNWNNTIGDRFFNSGDNGRQWNGDVQGLRDTLRDARQQLDTQEFNSLVRRISEGTNSFIYQDRMNNIRLNDGRLFNSTVFESPEQRSWDETSRRRTENAYRNSQGKLPLF